MIEKIADYLASDLTPMVVVALLFIILACKARSWPTGLIGGAILALAVFLAVRS